MILLAPATAYLYLAYPDWWWLYLVDPARVPRLVVVPIVTVAAAAVGAGYHAAARLLVLAPDRRALPASLGGLAALILLVGFLLRGRLLRDGSFDDYRLGRALPLFEVKLGYALVAVAVGLTGAAAFVGWELLKDGRKAQDR